MQNKKTIDKRSVPKTIYDRLLTEDTRIVEEWSRMLALGFKPGSRKEGRVKGRNIQVHDQWYWGKHSRVSKFEANSALWIFPQRCVVDSYNPKAKRWHFWLSR